jgi:Anti-sigma factor NepR
MPLADHTQFLWESVPLICRFEVTLCSPSRATDCSSSSVNLAHKKQKPSFSHAEPNGLGLLMLRHFGHLVTVRGMLPKFRCGVHQLTSGLKWCNRGAPAWFPTAKRAPHKSARRPFRISVHNVCAGAGGTNTEIALFDQNRGIISRVVPFRAGAPDVNVAQTDEAEKLRRESLTQVGNGLRDYYGNDLEEVIPGRLTELLQRLDESTKAECENHQKRNKRTGG